MIQSLDVMLWGRKVGTLISTRKRYNEQFCFYFAEDFVKSGLDIFPLRASINGVSAQSGLPVYPDTEKVFGGLPSFISDSLPDHWGNLVFQKWAKSHGIRQKDLSALDRLAYIGRRGMGALEFVPPTAENMETPFKIEISQLSEFAKEALAAASNFHAVLSPELAIESLFKVGTSAGGRRPKAVINVNTGTGECYSGQIATPLPGFTPMIIKFDEHSDVPTTRIEYSYYLMATDAGLNMMPSMLVKNGDSVHFLTQRFDRNGNEKVHVQTLAAMSPTSSSYEDLFDTAYRLGISSQGITGLFLQMVMNVISGNVDDHNKNFSFVMSSNGRWSVSPAYDFTFTIDPSAPEYINRHSMTINGKNSGITRNDLLTVADRFGIRRSSTIIGNVLEKVKDYRKFAVIAGVPEEWIEKIETEIESRMI